MSKNFTHPTASAFALVDLPEVVKAALFSRYSRTNLGLRELYETEFVPIQEDVENSFHGEGEAQAQKRAEAFFERVLDGFGDDSVAELGGAHLALEDISILATKVIEHGRIGAAYLEKSTRYVDFSQKVAGQYKFVIPPELNIALQSVFDDACTMLFDTYVELMPKVRERLGRETERSPDINDAAFDRAVKAKAFDICRGLLPASTKTNMGVYANGRFYEAMLIKLMTHSLGELRQIGNGAQHALNEVIPSLIQRADVGHRHFGGFADFYAAARDIKGFLPKPMGIGLRSQEPGVRLSEYQHDAEARVMAGLLYEELGDRVTYEALRAAASVMDSYDRMNVFGHLADARNDRRHKLPRGLEHADYTVEIVADYGMYRDFHRHRVLTHQRQNLGCSLGFVIAPEMDRPGWQEIRDVYIGAMQHARKAWAILMQHTTEEVAQYVVPLAYNIRWLMKANLREWVWITELRTTPQGHPNYRRVAQEIFHSIIAVHPEFRPFFKFVNMEGYDLGRAKAEQRQENRS